MIKFANYSASILAGFILSIDTAFAGAATASPTAGISQFLVLGGFLLIFYLLIWRPQSKRAKAQRDLMQSIQPEDEVVTAGGIVGKVLKVTDQFVVLKLNEHNEAVIQKQAISASLPKGTMKTIC
jgi:preprotein translocase subunit YajC